MEDLKRIVVAEHATYIYILTQLYQVSILSKWWSLSSEAIQNGSKDNPVAWPSVNWKLELLIAAAALSKPITGARNWDPVLKILPVSFSMVTFFKNSQVRVLKNFFVITLSGQMCVVLISNCILCHAQPGSIISYDSDLIGSIRVAIGI